MESRFKANLFGEDTSVAHSLYLQRHLAARLVDSWRAIAAIRDYEEIRHFVAEAKATDDAAWLIEMLTKKLGSKEKTPVEKLFYVERQRTIHLASVDDDELRKTLEGAGEEVAQIGLFHGDEKMVIEFPEAALTRAVFGDPNEPAGEQVLERRSALSEETLRRFGRPWGKSPTLFLARRGIHPTRLQLFGKSRRRRREAFQPCFIERPTGSKPDGNSFQPLRLIPVAPEPSREPNLARKDLFDGLRRDWMAARVASLDMSARGKLQSALVEVLETKQERRRSARPACEAMRLLRLDEQLVSVGVNDHDGIAVEQRTGRHLPLMGIVGRDEVRSIGIASGHVFIFNTSEDPLSCGIDVGVVTHDSRHCLTIAGASVLAFLIAAAIA